MLISEIVTLALRMARIVPLRDNPTSNEAAMGLKMFQAMLDQWAVSGMFGKLTDVEKSASYAPEIVGERIRISSGTVTLPDTIARGEDLAPWDLSMIEVIHTGNSTRAVHIYDQTRGEWVQINNLALQQRPRAGSGRLLLMAYISLGKGAYRRDDGDLPEFRLINLYPEETPAHEQGIALLSRPGLVEHYDFGDGPVLGLFQQDGAASANLLTVTGGSLYDAADEIGGIDGTALARWAGTETEVLVTAGRTLWRYDGTTLNSAGVTFGENCPAVMFLAGRFIALRGGTGEFHYSDTLDGSDWDALNYYTAESSPDLLIDGIVVNDEAWLFGSHSTEVWVATGNGDDPYSRIEGRNYSKGILNAGALTLFDNTAAWVGHDGIVYRGDARPIRISDHGIEERIANSTACYLSAYVESGHSFLVLRTDQGTFAFDAATSAWCQFESYLRNNFRGHVCAEVGRTIYWGDDTSGQVFRFTRAVYSDDGGTLTALFTGAIPLIDPVTIDNASLSVAVGVTADYTSEPTVEMRSSRDGGHVWTAWDEASLGNVGAFRTIASWRALGMFDAPGALFEFRITDPVLRRVSGIRVNDTAARRG